MARSRISRFLRWLLLALILAAAVLALLARLFHWDDRARLWWKEAHTSEQARAESVWLPGYRAVIQGKPLKGGLEGQETSDLAYNPVTRTLFTVTGKKPLLGELSLDGEVLRVIPLLGLENPEGVAVLPNGNVAVTDERQNSLTIFHLDPQTHELSTAKLASFDFGI